jgi:hypothetical protein
MWFAARMLDMHPHTLTLLVALTLVIAVLIGLTLAFFGLRLM